MQLTGSHTEMDVNGAVEALTSARKVVIVPGYGLAVANAQYAVAELVKSLRSRGIEVRQAGPGQRHLLLGWSTIAPNACADSACVRACVTIPWAPFHANNRSTHMYVGNNPSQRTTLT